MNPSPRQPGRDGFTAVELLVVMAIVVLLLGVGLPAFNQMRVQAEKSQARSIIGSALQRAHVLSVTTRSPAAVRFVPAAWEEADSDVNAIRGPQAVSIYQFRFSATNPQQDGLEFNQWFERVNDLPPQNLPGDLWVAPAEALMQADGSGYNGQGILQDNPGDFDVNADLGAESLYDADDFLIVFDPENGVQPSRWPLTAAPRKTAWQVNGYDPRPGRLARSAWELTSSGNVQIPRRPFQRFNFAGIAMYDREVFIERHFNSNAADRQAFLRQEAEVFYVDRIGGGLIAANEAKEK